MNEKTIDDIINQSDLVNAIASMSSDATNVDTRSQIIPDERFDQGLQMRMPDSEEALTEEEQNERLMSLVMGVAGGGGGKGVKTLADAVKSMFKGRASSQAPKVLETESLKGARALSEKEVAPVGRVVDYMGKREMLPLQTLPQRVALEISRLLDK